MSAPQPHRIRSIRDFHRYAQLRQPDQPLVSVIDFGDMDHSAYDPEAGMAMDFYAIALKRDFKARMKYGQDVYDFDGGGVMAFTGPGQVLKIETEAGRALRHAGRLLLVHPDFLLGTALAGAIRQYDYFRYSVAEALHLSEDEEAAITSIIRFIEGECRAGTDRFSQAIIVSQLELLLNYANRFYHRQFLTRKISSRKILADVELVLDEYLGSDELLRQGLPTVQYVAGRVHVSPDYLSSMLRVLTGQNTQQLIHEKLIGKAKERLSATSLTVSEVAYALGFERPQSFSRFFKAKTALSPLEFRESVRN